MPQEWAYGIFTNCWLFNQPVQSVGKGLLLCVHWSAGGGVELYSAALWRRQQLEELWQRWNVDFMEEVGSWQGFSSSADEFFICVCLSIISGHSGASCQLSCSHYINGSFTKIVYEFRYYSTFCEEINLKGIAVFIWENLSVWKSDVTFCTFVLKVEGMKFWRCQEKIDPYTKGIIIASVQP